MSRAPSWLEPAGGTSADTLYDSMEATEGDKLGETVREEKKREKGLLTVRSFRQLPHRPRRGQTPPPVKAAMVSQIQAGDARGPSMSIDLQLRRHTPTHRVGGTRSMALPHCRHRPLGLSCYCHRGRALREWRG
jgi:hypothetical protein